MAKMMTVQEVAEQLKLHPQTVYRLIRQGDLATIRVGMRIRISEETVQKYVGQFNFKEQQ